MAWFLENVVPQLRQANPQAMAVLSEATASPTELNLFEVGGEHLPGVLQQLNSVPLYLEILGSGVSGLLSGLISGYLTARVQARSSSR